MAKSAVNPTAIPRWPPNHEVNLLNAILEIADEPVESYDPSINLFDRINNNLEKSLTDREILDKIKQLKKRFRKMCRKMKSGNCHVKRTRVFEISQKIWGKEREMKMNKEAEMDAKRCDNSSKVNPEEGSRPNHKQEHEPRKKRVVAESKYEWQPARKKHRRTGRNCFEKKIAKQLNKQQRSEDISKGSFVLPLRAENKCKELSSGSVFVSSKVNPQGESSPNCLQGASSANCLQEASRPNCEREHELTKKQNDAEPNYDLQPAEQKAKERLCRFCRESGHIARDCVAKKIAKQPTKNQRPEDISDGSVVLQCRTENKCEELSGGSIFVSSGVNLQVAFRPNCESEHELTKRQNDAEHNFEPQPANKKIANQPTKQQETEAISKGPVVLQFGAENKCEELYGGSVFVSSKVSPPEASRPNCQQEHELTTKCGDAELNYEQQPAEQKLTKQQENKNVSKGSIKLQFEVENKCEELSGDLAVASSQPASLRLRSEQTWQRDEVPSCSLHPAHEAFWDQRMKVYYRSQPDATQQASGNWEPPSQPPYWEPPSQPPYWGPPPQPANCGFRPIPHQPANWGPPPIPLQPSIGRPLPISPQPANWGPPPILPQPCNGRLRPIPPQHANWGRSQILLQHPNCGPPPVPMQPFNGGLPLVPPQHPNWGPSSISPQFSKFGLPPVPPQSHNCGPPPSWGRPRIPSPPPNCGPPPPNCSPPPTPPLPPNCGPPQPPNCSPPQTPPPPPDCGPPLVPLRPPDHGPPPSSPQFHNVGGPLLPLQHSNGGPSPVPPRHPDRGPPPVPRQLSNCGPTIDQMWWNICQQKGKYSLRRSLCEFANDYGVRLD